jgi:hypothetical protein
MSLNLHPVPQETRVGTMSKPQTMPFFQVLQGFASDRPSAAPRGQASRGCRFLEVSEVRMSAGGLDLFLAGRAVRVCASLSLLHEFSSQVIRMSLGHDHGTPKSASDASDASDVIFTPFYMLENFLTPIMSVGH